MDEEKDLAKRIQATVSELNKLFGEASGMGIKVEIDYYTVTIMGEAEDVKVVNVSLSKITRITEY